MKGKALLATWAFTAMALAPVMLAQSPQKQQRPQAQAGTQLVAWTQDQKPNPMPSTQSTPAPAPPAAQTPATPTGQQDNTQKQPAAQSFSGTIMKSGDNYVLKTSDNMTYQLDDQTRAKQFEGKQVQVTGSLDSTNNTIKVQDIKSAS
jgi:hypothetical protein